MPPANRNPGQALTLDDLKHCSLLELETLYRNQPAGEPPTGRYRGVFLQRLDSAGKRKPLFYVSFAFAYLPFGIDFDARQWFFYHHQLRAGRFTLQQGPSRWRDTETYQMHYQSSALPGLIKNKLYDEVKPLNRDLLLGLGGVNRDQGGGHFYFALTALT